jgi:pimeloyl-ACP methyl ester carboxylesterase
VRGWPPYGHHLADSREIFSQITCPVLLFWGMESWAVDPETDDRAAAIRNHRLVKVPQAGHWVHHDQLQRFLAETKEFLKP